MSNSIQRGDMYPINLGFYAETEIYNYTTGAWEEYLSLSDIQWTTLGMIFFIPSLNVFLVNNTIHLVPRLPD